jgi:DNA-binding XRE family transcriptional regulator
MKVRPLYSRLRYLIKTIGTGREEDGMQAAQHKENKDKCPNRSTPLPALRELRRSRGLSQRELGRLAKVSPGTVYRLENGLRGSYPATLRKLAGALEVPTADLVRDHRPGRGYT